MPERQQVDPQSSLSTRKVRSRVSNGKAYMERVDGRSAIARRMRDLRAELLAAVLHRYNAPTHHGVALFNPPIGYEALNAEAAALVKTTVMLMVQAEQLEAKIASGQPVDHDDLVRVVNLGARSLERLRALAKPLKPQYEASAQAALAELDAMAREGQAKRVALAMDETRLREKVLSTAINRERLELDAPRLAVLIAAERERELRYIACLSTTPGPDDIERAALERAGLPVPKHLQKGRT